MLDDPMGTQVMVLIDKAGSGFLLRLLPLLLFTASYDAAVKMNV